MVESRVAVMALVLARSAVSSSLTGIVQPGCESVGASEECVKLRVEPGVVLVVGGRCDSMWR